MTASSTPHEFDRDRSRAFSQRLMGIYGGASTALLITLGTRTGLLAAAATGPGTSAQIADRAGLNERYVREWLHGMVASGVVDHDDGVFTLPPEHAISLTGDSFLNTSALGEMIITGGGQLDELAAAIRDGEGVAFHDQNDGNSPDVMGRLSRGRYDTFLVGSYLASIDGLTERLQEGIRVADIGCGTGRVVNLIGQAFPASQVVGVDLSPTSVEAARAEAADMGLANVTFQQTRIEDLEGPIDLVTAFDVIHDLGDPDGATAHIRSVLADDGAFVMCESSAPSTLDERAALPWAPMMYGLSLMSCVPTARSQGGEGLGNMWGREAAEALLARAGFTSVDALPAKGDPMNALYVARR